MRNSITTAIVERNVIVDRGINADRRTVVFAGEGMVCATGTPTRYLHTPAGLASKRGAEMQRFHQPGRLCLAVTPAAALAAASWRAPRALSSRRRAALASQLARFRG